MLDIFEQYATDDVAENQGVWVPHGDAKFLVARSGNRAYGKELSKLVEQNKVLLDKGDEAADKLSEKLMIEVLAKTVLLGWEGVGFKGQPLEYTTENAAMLLAVKDFRRKVAEWSDNLTLFKAKLVEEQEGN